MKVVARLADGRTIRKMKIEGHFTEYVMFSSNDEFMSRGTTLREIMDRPWLWCSRPWLDICDGII